MYFHWPPKKYTENGFIKLLINKLKKQVRYLRIHIEKPGRLEE